MEKNKRFFFNILGIILKFIHKYNIPKTPSKKASMKCSAALSKEDLKTANHITMVFTKLVYGELTKTTEVLPEPQLFRENPVKQHFDNFLEAIQDIRYMGQMKQRWLEIKKLHNGATLYDVRA